MRRYRGQGLWPRRGDLCDLATVGAGVRIGDDVRPYGTVALPLLPTISVKGNAGPHYYALGLRVGL